MRQFTEWFNLCLLLFEIPTSCKMFTVTCVQGLKMMCPTCQKAFHDNQSLKKHVEAGLTKKSFTNLLYPENIFPIYIIFFNVLN